MLGKIFRSPVTSIVLFLVAAGLLLSSSIGGTMAVLNIVSDDYLAEISLDEIAVGLTEANAGHKTTMVSNGRVISRAGGYTEGSNGVLLDGLVPEGEEFTLGKTYQEELGVLNYGAIDEYVRVTVYRYWEKDGKRAPDLDPSYIDLHFLTGGDWVIDDSASTAERTVLYYTKGALPKNGGQSSAFTDTLTISPNAASSEYNGAQFFVHAVVDGVQNHNADKAITSAWGHNFLGYK